MNPSLPPLALRFLAWLKMTDGRDKLYRLVPIHILKNQSKPNKDLIERLSKGAKAVGLSRKLMRFFRAVQFYQDFILSVSVNDAVERTLAMTKALALFMWMLIDHTQWLGKVGYLKLTNEKQLTDFHSKSWFIGLLAGVLLSGYKLKKLQSTAPNTKEFQKKSNKLKMGLFKSGTDLIIPSARLGWINVSDLVVGTAGTITSLIGIFDTFPAAVPS